MEIRNVAPSRDDAARCSTIHHSEVPISSGGPRGLANAAWRIDIRMHAHAHAQTYLQSHIYSRRGRRCGLHAGQRKSTAFLTRHGVAQGWSGYGGWPPPSPEPLLARPDSEPATHNKPSSSASSHACNDVTSRKGGSEIGGGIQDAQKFQAPLPKPPPLSPTRCLLDGISQQSRLPPALYQMFFHVDVHGTASISLMPHRAFPSQYNAAATRAKALPLLPPLPLPT